MDRRSGGSALVVGLAGGARGASSVRGGGSVDGPATGVVGSTDGVSAPTDALDGRFKASWWLAVG
ncbi:hypothetical protein [Halorubellus sp. PRR65]|uniref:hypothetical protein n=1 Tax=Halorubellus sp. PRR65 TaxID=3098148 RepID=UPI002B2627B9|nr:hypothetical protein [Halorubellus sp. PRR65]